MDALGAVAAAARDCADMVKLTPVTAREDYYFEMNAEEGIADLFWVTSPTPGRLNYLQVGE